MSTGETAVVGKFLAWAGPVAMVLIGVVWRMVTGKIDRNETRLDDLAKESVTMETHNASMRRVADERSEDMGIVRDSTQRIEAALLRASDKLEEHAKTTTNMGKEIYAKVDAVERDLRSEVRDVRGLVLNAPCRPKDG